MKGVFEFEEEELRSPVPPAAARAVVARECSDEEDFAEDKGAPVVPMSLSASKMVSPRDKTRDSFYARIGVGVAEPHRPQTRPRSKTG